MVAAGGPLRIPRPAALGALAPEERRQVYGKLRLKVEVSGNGSVEACFFATLGEEPEVEVVLG